MKNKVLVVFVFWLVGTAVFGQNLKQATHAMVVSARKEASEIGVAVMKKGGNAFDAMVATELALAVAYPYAGNIGGGGFMVFRKASGEVGSLDYREKAPLAATKDMYCNKDGTIIPNVSTEGALAVGVPGTIAGIFAVHDKFGKLPISELFQPAIELALKGVEVTTKQAAQFQKYEADIARISGSESLLAKAPQQGAIQVYKALAATLTQISKQGSNAFYKGEIAKKMIAFLKQKGGILTLKDLELYQVKWRAPVEFSYKDLKIIAMAPPSSGGITLQQILKMVEPFPLASYGHNSEQYIQVLTEAERRAFADRNFFLGDPDFVKMPLKAMVNDLYLKERMQSFSFDKATLSASLPHGTIAISESNETTHYSIIDPEGNAVSVTTTLNGAFGSKLYSDELGFFFNNEMDDFSSKPGTPNSYGLLGSAANSIAPQKRMLSSMTPTIVEKKGQLFLILGTPGGSTIITSVLQTLLNVTEFKMNIQEAVNAPRFHHQWLPDEVLFEPNAFSAATLEHLKNKGYNCNEKNAPVLGKVDAILVAPNFKIEGGADTRGDDAAVGY